MRPHVLRAIMQYNKPRKHARRTQSETHTQAFGLSGSGAFFSWLCRWRTATQPLLVKVCFGRRAAGVRTRQQQQAVAAPGTCSVSDADEGQSRSDHP
jgi:hypothetical protein